MARLRFLLLQVRNSDDPMRQQEVRCFADALGCEQGDVQVFDLLGGVPDRALVDRVDCLLFGGSGDYSAAADDDPWLDRTLDALRDLYEHRKPTFASCWGFQAMAHALGGRCIHDEQNAELGTIDLRLTNAGGNDPVFEGLPPRFTGQAGHQDHVVTLPAAAVLLASSERVRNQAFTFTDTPIYCTQFHPELNRDALLERLRCYPQYVREIAGLSLDEFADRFCQETPEANQLLRRFVEVVFD